MLRSLTAVMVLGVVLLTEVRAEQIPVGLKLCDGASGLAKRVARPGGEPITEIRVVGNDPETVFPLVKVANYGGDWRDETIAAALFRDVRSNELGEILLPLPQTVSQGGHSDLLVVVVFPAGGRLTGRQGPGLMGTRLEVPNGSFLATSEGELIPITVDLDVAPVTAAAKAGGWDSSPQPVATPYLKTTMPAPSRTWGGIEFGIATRAAVELAIYDVRGRLVRKLVDDILASGVYRQGWDATSSSGVRVAAGVYIVSLTVSGSKYTRKIVVAQ